MLSPFDPEQALDRHGISLRLEELPDGLFGLATVIRGRGRIYVAPFVKADPVLYRCVVAHELIHLLGSCEMSLYEPSHLSKAAVTEERRARREASLLLMPLAPLVALLRQGLDVAQLAHEFGVLPAIVHDRFDLAGDDLVERQRRRLAPPSVDDIIQRLPIRRGAVRRPKLRAIIYCRRLDGLEQPTPNAQIRACRQVAVGHGWDVVRSVVEHSLAVSVTDLPEFAQLVTAANAPCRDFDVVLFGSRQIADEFVPLTRVLAGIATAWPGGTDGVAL